ncbi:hypothetical protein BAE44_0001209 [Dichanthelium oligosanthes]|uniref:RNase H type-1 domain-containing protein n=1 Tax=Dichanthelium oligosanthes TaxID=888268 RepID=A0A1E5WK48_9POAL|nr:hypothetical protein BAE44_0001209 [Dichanthelium oligosanthes]
MRCPNRLKHFVWRIAHNSLALSCNLKRSGMDINRRCHVCRRLDEDGGHLFFKCKNVKQVWREMHLEEIRQGLAGLQSAIGVVEQLLDLDHRLQLKVLFLLNNWWHERNKIREVDQRRGASEIAYLSNWRAEEIIQLRVEKQSVPTSATQQKWRRPAQGFVKINVDGAFDLSTREGRWRYVIRDEEGSVIQTGAGKLEHVFDPMHVELSACIRGVRAAAERGIGQIILETDALQVKQAVGDMGFHLAVLRSLIHELKEMLHDEFISSSIEHVPRDCNQVVHGLAVLGASCSAGSNFIMMGAPDCILDVVASNLAGSQV